MTITADFTEAMTRCPLVAILRGVRPDEIIDIADGLVEAGFTMIEVPLNSPEPLDSIGLIARRYDRHVLVGAGTMLSVDDVGNVTERGGRLMVSPNSNPAVISAAVAAGMAALPGYFTPTEAFAALEAGAHGLKLFPAEGASPAVLKAQRAVLPKNVPVLAVGGVSVENLGAWMAAGAAGAGLGGSLYKPGDQASIVKARATAFVEALRAV
ncbi:2-dehydro-3-deoxy-6-phosphogalactonate aldolase [Novosphingobium terrae]|uniref:2-dehydro-3-deoxy-6-phosphogalactonate aldolase n=1 Tax=Novosphingobium terrae TaxID=2726189 RepID=UPI001982012D|nr:2-dehydro-3-deoxy-6-phosphogalactonate aldolase [Novosphingobium terrae]